MNSLNFFSKIKFLFKKPKVIIVTGKGKETAKETISQVLKSRFKIDKKILLFETDFKNIKNFEFLLKNSSLPALVVTHIGDIPPDKDFFAGNREETVQIRKLLKLMPPQGFLVLNFDDETVRELKTETSAHPLTFGFQAGADFQATDIKLNRGTNFKVNYKGNIVPVWLEKIFGKEQIYAALAGVGAGIIFDLNLVEISQGLRKYQGLSGKMKLIEGVKNSWILDDSESATVSSMIEAVNILGKIQGFGRKIAVLGDILGIGKYTIEAHEAIGEKVCQAADLLFTFGPRAKFIAKGAHVKGMALEKIFQYDTIIDGKIALQNEIKEGDLILVDGSKEMKMGEIVKEIKAA
jgi:UDP-N-acetylmuramoyl-tripeptide--D-alanyl-D-alanine ligase